MATPYLENGKQSPPLHTQVVIAREEFGFLIDVLRNRGYQVLGPTVGDQAIVYDELTSVDDLPAGWTDKQEAGTYRIEKSGNDALFDYAVGPHSWKKFLHPPVLRLWHATRTEEGVQVEEADPHSNKMAFLGVRACELSAIRVQDRVFLEGPYVDPQYDARREHVFIVALNCGKSGGTCFCGSMGTGPEVKAGYDLSMTEVLDDTGDTGNTAHYFVMQAGSEEGADVLAEIPHRAASDAEVARAVAVVERTAQEMGRSMETKGLKELLYASYEHPRWEEVAQRCLACTNCTMVCPTCFCTTVEDTTDLAGTESERVRKWDSCFTADFSYIHGGSVRPTRKSRYRQWLTHKLGTWHDQFGTSGCVGCGRCITWCPVGIDITEEVAAIRGSGEA